MGTHRYPLTPAHQGDRHEGRLRSDILNMKPLSRSCIYLKRISGICSHKHFQSVCKSLTQADISSNRRCSFSWAEHSRMTEDRGTSTNSFQIQFFFSVPIPTWDAGVHLQLHTPLSFTIKQNKQLTTHFAEKL